MVLDWELPNYGSFRRRASGDWDFVLGGKGYTGGLEQLLPDYGIAVE
ncbi:hypothetical protein ACFVZ2_40790 [Streptomyces lasiicapitis]